MPKNKFFFTVLLTLTLILGGMVLTVKAQPTPTPTGKTPLQIISSEQFLRRLEENLPKDTKPVYVFSGAYQRLFYRPANKNWNSNLLTIPTDRKSTRLNSSHASISYAVFCLKKKKVRNHESSY